MLVLCKKSSSYLERDYSDVGLYVLLFKKDSVMQYLFIYVFLEFKNSGKYAPKVL